MTTKINPKNFVVILLSLIVLGCTVAAGKTIYVKDGEPAEFNNIQAAIDDADEGDVNGDCRADFLDCALMSLRWLEDHSP
jgi:hypothetical protein